VSSGASNKVSSRMSGHPFMYEGPCDTHGQSSINVVREVKRNGEIL